MPIVLTEMIVLPILVLTFWVLAYRGCLDARWQTASGVPAAHAARERIGGVHRCQRAVPAFLL